MNMTMSIADIKSCHALLVSWWWISVPQRAVKAIEGFLSRLVFYLHNYPIAIEFSQKHGFPCVVFHVVLWKVNSQAGVLDDRN